LAAMSLFDRMKNNIHSTYVKGVEKIMPTLKDSKFLEEGVLTPEEFVAAGDLLVHKCPTWTWEAAEEGKAVDYLPRDKQFLLTRNVPCMQRVKAFEGQINESTTTTIADDDGDWCAPNFDAPGAAKSSTASATSSSSSAAATEAAAATTTDAVATEDAGDDDDESSDIPDMETFDGENLGEEEDDDAAFVAAPAVAASAGQDDGETNIVLTRTYDISITYDKYYQTPKLWLFGYDESRQPLKPEQVFQDISVDHAQKTVTIDTHPAQSTAWAYIHPCRHAAVMKRLVERQLASNKTPRVDQYLFLFLKFINSAIPTIEYDFTMEMGVD